MRLTEVLKMISKPAAWGSGTDKFVSLFHRGERILVCRRTSEGNLLDRAGMVEVAAIVV